MEVTFYFMSLCFPTGCKMDIVPSSTFQKEKKKIIYDTVIKIYTVIKCMYI